MIVYESLNEYQHDNLIIEKLLTEGINIKDVQKLKNPYVAVDNLINKTNIQTTTNSTRVKLLIAIITLIGYLSYPRESITKDIVQAKAIELADIPKIERADVYNATKDIVASSSPIAIDADHINKLNDITPKRFSTKQLALYNKYDQDIITAVRELRARGEKPNENLIKSIMLIETGMLPRENKIGYKGFPQTKGRIVKGINDRYGTSFTMKDMYNPKKAAKFIHYMLKDMYRSKFVKNNREAVAAYNWGLGNWTKHRIGKKDLPKETKDYISMVSVLTR